jgi:peptidoglycan hydrolase-like protein with peptidoglycan-binding domain
MKLRPFFIAFALAVPLVATAQDALTSLHPEDQYPDPPAEATLHPYSELVAQVQRALRGMGFDAGPPNGDFGTKTQAALAQFQLSQNIPASGSLDDHTLDALGVIRQQASAGGTTEAEAPSEAPAEPSNPNANRENGS